ncbi:hypothetical protein TRAPUB_12837 [Trametes pubescens]|uniref:F-box domain-containing protein n=1 Tax=Trametes pubescens TaxID=154538 RepID=A0A1M2VSR1_TRAPU|nr:hypothetical protein TRAPUB_12837 [Trametes pubescens]
MRATPLVPDVLELICEWTDPGSLSIMARTARVLHEPAIHALWRVLPSLIPILRCFPADSWTIEGDTFGSSVRTAAFRSQPTDAAVWETMCCLRPTITLFPQLRTLHWKVIRLRDKCLPSFLICVGSHLSRMVFESLERPSRDKADELRPSLDIIAERFPGLQELQVGHFLEDRDRNSEIGSLFPTLAPSFPSLVSFVSRVWPITPTALLSLVRLNTLVSIAVRLRDDAGWPQAPNTQISSNLEEIELTSSLPAYTAFSKAITLPYAMDLTLELTSIPASHLISDLCRAIRRQCSPDVLETVHIDDVDTTAHAREGFIFPTHLRPLLDFKKLESLDLLLPSIRGYALDDDFCADMAKAWPRIRTLMLRSGTAGVHEVLPSVRVLPLFAIHCPKLERLGLNFDARHWNNQAEFNADDLNAEIYGALADRASTSVLSQLNVGSSPILVPELVAAFLDRVFPSLRWIWGGEGVDTPWEAVERFLSLFKHVRKDERRRLTQELSKASAGRASGDRKVAVPR